MTEEATLPPTEPTLMNTPEARTQTGEIVDQTQPPSEPTQPTVPEAYSDFTAPEGVTIDQTILAEATPIFKELGLSQTNAQKLVDFYNKQTSSINAALHKQMEDTRLAWRDEVRADKDIGGKLDSVLVEIGRAKDKLPADVRSSLNAALDFTGAGDHPAIVKAFYEFAKLINEGTHVSGGGPSPAGQNKTGQTQRPSAAQSLYPNLP